jgi:enoyl-CoA hydratase/carnithine racemase
VTYRLVQTRLEGTALVLTMCRASRRNALSFDLITEVVAALAQADGDASIRGVVIAGDGPAFSAGADLNEALAVESVPDSLRYLAGLKRLTTAIETLSKPVVAAMHGACRTGGLELALACDRRVAGADATFSVTSSRIGSVAGLGGTQRLARVVGRSAALDLLMTGRVVDAVRAQEIGMVDQVVAEGQHVKAAVGWIDECAAGAPIAVWLAKLAVTVGGEADLATGLEYERLLTALAFTTQDRRDGMASVLEKRSPQFVGK